MATTVRDIITDALTDIGVLGEGDVASAGNAALGLRTLNRLLDKWKAHNLAIPKVESTSFTIVASTASYTVGTGATIDVERPNLIVGVSYIDSSNSTEVHLSGFTDRLWALVAIKTETGALPTSYYYKPTYPNGTLYLWPIPTSSTLTGYLYSGVPVDEFDSIDDDVTLPPGYRELLVTHLGVRLCPSFGRQAPAELVQSANDAEATVKRSNTRTEEMDIDPALIGLGMGYDIYTDGY